MIVMQNGSGMPFRPGGDFQGPGRPMPFGQVGFPGPPSPDEMSAVGSIAAAAETAERVQRAGSPRPQSPSVVSAQETEKREQCTFETQMQRQQDDRQQQAAGALLVRGYSRTKSTARGRQILQIMCEVACLVTSIASKFAGFLDM